jgi:hypothetical protein
MEIDLRLPRIFAVAELVTVSAPHIPPEGVPQT